MSSYFSSAVLGIQTSALHTLARVPPTELQHASLLGKALTGLPSQASFVFKGDATAAVSRQILVRSAALAILSQHQHCVLVLDYTEFLLGETVHLVK